MPVCDGKTERFRTGTVMTVTTGRMLTGPIGKRGNGIGDMYRLLNWMTDDVIFVHHVGRAIGECSQWLLRWFPELSGVGAAAVAELDIALGTDGLEGRRAATATWLARTSAELGLRDYYDVPRIPPGHYRRVDPYDGLADGANQGVIITVVGSGDLRRA